MTKPVVNLKDIELLPRAESFAATGEAADRYDAQTGMIGSLIGAKLLGYNLTRIPAGHSAFPLHNHHVNEEMFLIVDGTGELKVGDKVYQIRKGDIIACPPGGPATAHQLTSSLHSDLTFLAVSTRLSPEYVEYPNSGKFGVYADITGADGNPVRTSFIGRSEDGRDYWEGE